MRLNVSERRAQVVGPAENARFALYTLQSLDRWLKALPAPDVIHWNNGSRSDRFFVAAETQELEIEPGDGKALELLLCLPSGGDEQATHSTNTDKQGKMLS